MTEGLELLPDQWYGWQMMPGYVDAPYFSPIRMREVLPLKTGHGRLRLKFHNCLYAAGVRDFDLTIRVLAREQTYLMGGIEYKDWPGAGRACVISPITFEWLYNCTPGVLEGDSGTEMSIDEPIEEFLDRAFCMGRTSDRTQLVNEDAESDLVDWAHRYNGYERLASSMNTLGELLEPVRQEYQRSGRVPEWCGVDLLRGWAFGLVRAERIWGMDPDEFHAVLNALRRHPAATPADVPPLDTMGGVD